MVDCLIEDEARIMGLGSFSWSQFSLSISLFLYEHETVRHFGWMAARRVEGEKERWWRFKKGGEMRN